MSHTRAAGIYVSVYLSPPLADFLEEVCGDLGLSVPVWLRDRAIEACPPEVQQEIKAAMKKPSTSSEPLTTAQAAAVEKHRPRVLELEARGYLESAICTTLRLPYAVVRQILTTKAKPKKGGAK